jgi:hypothetical protein
MGLKTIAFFLSAFLLLACTKDYNPSSTLTVIEQDQLMNKVIRYQAKSPEGISADERFYPAYNAYYDEQKSRHRLDAYFEEGENRYFLISRPAPSLVEKRVATGGKVKIDAEGNVIDYEEVFRTWKMADSLQIKKSLMLFDKMVKGESLEPYLTKNSAPEEYIEFPDDHTYFDKAVRTWKSK